MIHFIFKSVWVVCLCVLVSLYGRRDDDGEDKDKASGDGDGKVGDESKTSGGLMATAPSGPKKGT